MLTEPFKISRTECLAYAGQSTACTAKANKGLRLLKLCQAFVEVHQYAEVYEPVEDHECDDRCGYIKLINAGAAWGCSVAL